MGDYPQTPELDRRTTIINTDRKQTEVITDFIDWLNDEGIVLCRWGRYEDLGGLEMPVPIRERGEQLIAMFFEIDLQKIDQEQRAVLEWYSAQT